MQNRGTRRLTLFIVLSIAAMAFAPPANGTQHTITPPDTIQEVCTSIIPHKDFQHASDKELCSEYKRLKAIDDFSCKRWQSDLQLIMEELGRRYNGKRKAKIIKALGLPDEEADGIIIYYWRHRHDYLFFKRHLFFYYRADWYYAYE